MAFFNIRANTLTESHNNVESEGAWILDTTTVRRCEPHGLFNAFFFGKLDKAPVNGFPFGEMALMIFTRHGLFETFIGNADKTKTSQPNGILEMKSQFLIAELKHLFYDGSSCDLFSRRSFGIFITFLRVRGKILQDQLINGRVLVQYAAHGVQLFCLRMIYFWRHQRHLFFTNPTI